MEPNFDVITTSEADDADVKMPVGSEEVVRNRIEKIYTEAESAYKIYGNDEGKAYLQSEITKLNRQISIKVKAVEGGVASVDSVNHSLLALASKVALLQETLEKLALIDKFPSVSQFISHHTKGA